MLSGLAHFSCLIHRCSIYLSIYQGPATLNFPHFLEATVLFLNSDICTSSSHCNTALHILWVACHPIFVTTLPSEFLFLLSFISKFNISFSDKPCLRLHTLSGLVIHLWTLYYYASVTPVLMYKYNVI